MADKYIRNNGGTLTETEATVTSAGAGSAGKIPGLDAAGRLDNSMMPVGLGLDAASIVASENLAAGDLVNIWNDSGTVKVRKADASAAGKEADGFVLSATTATNSATVYMEGSNTQLSSLTGGSYYLSATTPGGATATAPTGTGKVVQRVGAATSATVLNFERGTPIVLA